MDYLIVSVNANGDHSAVPPIVQPEAHPILQLGQFIKKIISERENYTFLNHLHFEIAKSESDESNHSLFLEKLNKTKNIILVMSKTITELPQSLQECFAKSNHGALLNKPVLLVSVYNTKAGEPKATQQLIDIYRQSATKIQPLQMVVEDYFTISSSPSVNTRKADNFKQKFLEVFNLLLGQ